MKRKMITLFKLKNNYYILNINKNYHLNDTYCPIIMFKILYLISLNFL